MRACRRVTAVRRARHLSMTALTARDLRKSFGPQRILDGAAIAIDQGEKVGLIGRNGAGKSTIAKILAGLEPADGGTIAVRRGLSVVYLAQEPSLPPEASAREVVERSMVAWRSAIERHARITEELTAGRGDHDALIAEQAQLDDAIVRLGGWERGHEAERVLHRLGVDDLDRPVGPRSGGERRRVALAALLVGKPDVALLDEPTNHLDADTAAWLEEHLRNEFPGAALLITHDRYFLDAICTRIIELERAVLSSYDGGYGRYLEKKAELLAHEDRAEQNRQNLLRIERDWLSRGPAARTTKQKARIQRAHALEAQGPANAGRPGAIELTGAVAETARLGKTVLELRGVSLAVGGRTLFSPFDLILNAGERIGILGPNGAGKTSLLRAVRGELAPATGEIVVGRHSKLAYLDQKREGLDDEKSIFDDVADAGGGSTQVTLGKEVLDLRSYLELFLFDPHKQRQPIGGLSGGERARVALAKILRTDANLLMFDEPTNDLDLPTLAAVEEMLNEFSGAALVVTHDRAFLDRVATAIIAFEKDPEAPDAPAKLVKIAGGFTDYAAWKAATEAEKLAKKAAIAPKNEVSSTPTSGQAPKKKSGLSWAEQKELDGMLDAIDRAEQSVAALEKELADPSLYASRGSEVAGLQGKLAAARAEVERLTARWEALEQKKAG